MSDKYDVFISYSRKDTKIADRICAAMDKEGISYFIDRQGIAGGMEFPTELADAICESTLFLFLASKNSYVSKYTINEITFAFNEKERNRILPYIIDQTELPRNLRFVFAGISWRVMQEAPIETVLMFDLLTLLGREQKKVEPERKETVEEKRKEERAIPTKNNSPLIVNLPKGVKLELVYIKPGTFTMGSPKDNQVIGVIKKLFDLVDRFDDETQHQVTLTQGYWLGKYEITQTQYEAVMNTNPSGFKGANLPVEKVSWDDAMTFCKKLTEIEKAAGHLPAGYEYTLPTEAQWEYACRAGTTTALNSGKNLSNTKQCPEMDQVGWYGYNSNDTTHPVGQKQPNAWGLYDMHGNVWEWCLDWYEDYPTTSVTDPVGPSTGSYRVMRGGSWYDCANGCRSANRGSNNPSGGSFIYGFRVALAPVQ